MAFEAARGILWGCPVAGLFVSITSEYSGGHKDLHGHCHEDNEGGPPSSSTNKGNKDTIDTSLNDLLPLRMLGHSCKVQ